MSFKPDKERFKDEKGRYIVQGLFLEDRYNTDLAVYTLNGEDKEYKGILFPSLKKLYLDYADPAEYLFAKEYLFDWPHWQRLCNNNVVGRHIEQWREELSLYLISEGLANMISLAQEGKSYQAAKFLADGGWVKAERGRPSNEEIQGELKKRADQREEFDEDFKLLRIHKGK